MRRGIYAIRDTFADSINGGVFVHATDAVAVRFFGDIASQKPGSNIVADHPTDHELIRVGYIEESGRVTEPQEEDWTPVVVLTGAQWKAAQDAFRQQQQEG